MAIRKKRGQVKNLFQGGWNGRVVVHAMIDSSLRNECRNENCRNTHSIAVESKLRCVRVRSCGGRRRYVVVHSSVLVMNNDQQAFFPLRRSSQAVVNVGDERLARPNVMR